MGNNGSQGLLLALPNAITISGINAGDFHQSNTCPVSLASDAFCSISLTFTPTAIGLRQATLSIADNASGSPQIVSLSGTGSNGTASIALSAGTLTFSTILAGTASPMHSPHCRRRKLSHRRYLHSGGGGLAHGAVNDFEQRCFTAIGLPQWHS